jgi:hypothetical protein
MAVAFNRNAGGLLVDYWWIAGGLLMGCWWVVGE